MTDQWEAGDPPEVNLGPKTYPIQKPMYGVIVGRFQVPNLHNGHMELFNTVRNLHQRVIVFLGVNPGGANVDSPLDFDTRRRMIQGLFPEFSVHPLLDCSSDETWSQNLDMEISKLAQYGKVTLYGGRSSFVPHYKGKYTPVELKLNISNCSGTSVRNNITNFVRDDAAFRAGIIYAINNLYPRVITCVDVAILHHGEHGIQMLLGRKVGEDKWRFVGGHADPSSESFEADAKREAKEETGLYLDSVNYIGSRLVDDWRWRKVPDKIKTLFFAAWTMIPHFKAQDDINELKWFTWAEISSINFEMVSEHIPLMDMLIQYVEEFK